MKKRILSLSLVLALCLALLPTAALAADSDFTIVEGNLAKYTGPGGHVDIPDGVTCIKGNAFQGCTNVTGITIPDSVTYIEPCAFAECTGLTDITLPGIATGANEYAFRGCTGLTSIRIRDGATFIGKRAFEGCTNLTEIAIPGSVTQIGYRAFADCTALQKVHYGGTAAQWANIQFNQENEFLRDAAIYVSSLSHFQPVRTYDGRFTDVSESDWYYDGVKTMYELGLMNGTSDTTFSPTANITFPEIKLLMARFVATYTGDEGGVPSGGDWTQDGVNYLWGRDLDVWLNPQADGLVSRCYVAGQLRALIDQVALPRLNRVADLPDVGRYTPHRKEILSLYDAGILTGSDEYGAFQPMSYISRAELATIMVRAIDTSQRKTLALKEMYYPGHGADDLARIAWADMPNFMAGIDTFTEMGGTMNNPEAYTMENKFIKLGMRVVGVAESGENYHYGKDMEIKWTGDGYSIYGLETTATDMYTAQRAVLKGLFLDSFGTDVTNKILAKIDEMVTIMTKGWRPQSYGSTDEALSWMDAHEYTTTYFQTENGVLEFKWGKYCAEFHVRYQ